MSIDRVTAAPENCSLIARDGLSAVIWELALADRKQQSTGAVWATPAISGLDAWLRELWEQRSRRIETDQLAVISGIQCDRLWREIIRDSASDAGVLGLSGLARWSRDARAGLHSHGIGAADALAIEADAEITAFEYWNRRFQASLDANGWVDPESLLYRLNRSELLPGSGDLLFVDDPDMTPELGRLLNSWRAANGTVEFARPDTVPIEAQAIVCPDPIEEIRLAAAWCAQKLDRSPESRLALVVPDLSSRIHEIEKLLQRYVDPGQVWHSQGQSLGSLGVFGAAFNAISMLCGVGGFGAISRWLRSPFFSDSGPAVGAAARLELELRSEPRIHSGFVRSYRHDGLRELIRARIPALVTKLDAALDRIPHRASPTTWVQVWQDCLKALEWRGFDQSVGDNLRNSWDRAWADLASLSAITGPIAPVQAVEEFERVLTRQSVYRPPGLSGVHLFGELNRVGPGYAGVWVTGFDDQSWPTQGNRNPLLGPRVQSRFGMDYLRPEAGYVRAESELDAMLGRVPEAVFSCPAIAADQPRTPNTRFSDWRMRNSAAPDTVPALADTDVAGPDSGSHACAALARPGSRQIETVPDPAPAFDGEFIPRGVRTLDLQSRCPAIAFIVSRLAAEPLERPVHGIGPLLRGNLVHRSLELLFAVENLNPERVDTSVEEAAAELFPKGDTRWHAQVRAEKDRTAGLLKQLLETEERRSEFRVARLEHRFNTRINAHQLRCRLDRLDVLASGSCLLIDYKTGRSSTSGWFGDRLQDCQLPLYAIGLTEPVGGIAVISLNDEGVRYLSAGKDVNDLPGRPVKLDEAGWNRQLDLWQDQLATLVGEFVAGDVRISSALQDDRDKRFAPLIRNLENPADA